MRLMHGFVCAVLVLASACFDPQVPTGLTCDKAEASACPAGQICDVDRKCCKPIGGGTCAGDVTDQGVAADLAPVTGCAFGGGVQLADGLWACKGIWELGKASSLCRTRLAKGVELTQAAVDKCVGLPGFYVTQEQVWPIEPKKGTCQAPETQSCTPVQPITITYRLGCGGYKSFKNYRDCAIKCGQLSQAAYCYGANDGYTCVNNSTDDKNTDPMMGVLCAG